MGLFDRYKKTTTVSQDVYYEPGDYYGAWLLQREEYERILGMSPAEMWRTQPYLRTVITFLARNIAQLGLHTYQLEGETDRVRLRTGGVVDVLRKPNRATTSYELVYGLVADLALYDASHWLLSKDPATPITRLPVPWVTPLGGDALGPEKWKVKINDKGETVEIVATDVLTFHGWNPLSDASGATPVSALKEILAEQVQAARYRELVWRRGGKVGSVLSRPADSPPWSEDARKQFKADWDAKFTGTGPQVGGTPMLEDGMTLQRVDFNSKEQQFVEGARLALNTVASVYHINPTMIGLLDNANYSNVREFRRMLYGDTLGPIIAQLEDRLNLFLVPAYDTRSNVYVEFNIDEKLQGNFEEQSAAMSSAIGAPWMTRNEGRSLRTMPAVDGGDELVTPLNVLVGGQPAPNVLAPVAAASADVSTKSSRLRLVKSSIEQTSIERVLQRFFARQRDATLGIDTWDEERWNSELADDLKSVLDGYDVDLLALAAAINRSTQKQLDDERSVEDGDASLVFSIAIETRAAQIAAELAELMGASA
jgi:HK97 family phage portal protein